MNTASVQHLTGRVIEEQKNYFVVASGSENVMATATGSLRKKRMRVCTGDCVDLHIISKEPLRAVIMKVHPRTSYINRPALANCSLFICVCTFKEPLLHLETLDRMLFSAQVCGVKPCIAFNKSDLLTPEEMPNAQAIFNHYQAAGIPAFMVSAKKRNGIDALLAYCKDHISAFAGLSGVGKTTIMSAIFPDNEFRIGELSAASTRGTHTTTTVSLLPLAEGGFIADTPGLSLVNIPEVPEENVVLYFKEIADCTGECRFNNCRHENEPGCSVLEKVDNGSIAPWRHNHYLKMYHEMRNLRRQYRQ